MVIMVDEDVDPFDLPQVMWALSSKVNPAGDLIHLSNISVLELDPGSSLVVITAKLIIDSCQNYSTPICCPVYVMIMTACGRITVRSLVFAPSASDFQRLATGCRAAAALQPAEMG